MKKMRSRRREWSFWFGILLQAMVLSESAVTNHKIPHKHRKDRESPYPPVQLHREEHQVVMGNGLVNITLSVPQGEVTGIQYNGLPNILDEANKPDHRGYWDVVWQHPGSNDNIIDKLEGTEFRVILEDESQVEVSFSTTFDLSANTPRVPLNIDKRYILRRGSSGFYTYGIFERLKGWPEFDLIQGRTVFKLNEKLFTYMAISDERQRIMPTSKDRDTGEPLAYPEAVLLTQPANSFITGEVDDKYQYSCDDKDCRVYGWISPNPITGFWMITPSIEFKTGGPLKQDLTSHVGPTVLSMFFSNHYAGQPLEILFRDGEPWKKVLGPVFVYLNSAEQENEPLNLWVDAKRQMLLETESWPYNFVHSEDYPLSHERGRVSGHLLVQDGYMRYNLMTGSSAYVGLAPPGDAGSWQRENKGYQFWTQADENGYFVIKNVRPGNYSLFAWVPGFIGDYKYQDCIIITPGTRIRLGNIVYQPPRNGPTLWEIGIPDRTALEFYIPDPNPGLMNQLYSVDTSQKYRQYGLWDRYTDLYPTQDLTFTIGIDNYQKDWFFAQVNRISGKNYIPTTWRIIFDLSDVHSYGTYMLQLALASACEAELLVQINSLNDFAPQFTTNLIGKDNSIARHGIHGLYLLYSVQIPGSQLRVGSNAIFLTQTRGASPWKGLMYDYIRLEGPPAKP